MQNSQLATKATSLAFMAFTVLSQAGDSYIEKTTADNSPDQSQLSYTAIKPLNTSESNIISTEVNSSLIPAVEITPYSQIAGELQSYLALDEDWDGYGGEAPASNVVNACIKLLNDIHAQKLQLPKPMLAGSGEVSLYWTTADKHIEIGFEEADCYSYLVSGDQVFGEDDFPVDEGLARKLFIELENLAKSA